MATRVLITGASGLIGAALHTCMRALHDIEPVLVQRKGTDLLAQGVPSRLVDDVRPDAVIHLAWSASGTAGYRHSPDNDRWRRATLELVGACNRRSVPLWATGTVVDGESGVDAYTSAKTRLREELAADIGAGRIGWLRPAYVFDERARRPALLAHALDARDSGATVDLLTPESKHDFVHASDVGAAIAAAFENQLMGVRTIGSGTTRSVADLVTALAVPWRPKAGSAPPAAHDDNAADVAWLINVGWRPRHTDRFFAGCSPDPDGRMQGRAPS